MNALIASLPGDGIGPEVMAAGLDVLQTIADIFDHRFNIVSARIGGSAIDHTGHALPEATKALCQQADAVLLGAVGGPQWAGQERHQRPESGLLDLRAAMKVYANLRPVKPHPIASQLSPLKSSYLKQVDLLVVRELTGGLYFGDKQEGNNKAVDTCAYSDWEVQRVVHQAARLARSRRGKVCLVDKANVLATSRLWREVTKNTIKQHYPDIELQVMLVDAAAMHLLSRPSQFDVILTENLFGDILTDEASMLAGSMGLLPSASLGDQKCGLYEPIHGSAPDIAGENKANPYGMILSVALALRHSLNLNAEADWLEAAVNDCLSQQRFTADLGGDLGTQETAQAISRKLLEYKKTGQLPVKAITSESNVNAA